MRKIIWKRIAAAAIAAAMLPMPAYAAAEEADGQGPDTPSPGLAQKIVLELPEKKTVEVPYITLDAYVREHNTTIRSFDFFLSTIQKTHPSSKLSDTREKLSDKKKQLSDLRGQLEDLQEELEDQQENLDSQELLLKIQLNAAKEGLQQLTPVVDQFKQLLESAEFANDPALKAAVLSLQLNLESIQGNVGMLEEVLDLMDDMSDKMDDISDELDDALADLKDASDELQDVLDDLDDAVESIDEAMDELYETSALELQAASDMLVFSAQNCHIALTALGIGRDVLDREIAAADRRLTVAEAQVELGMLTPSTLTRLKNTYASLTSMRDALALQEETLSGTLAQLCGYGPDTVACAVGLPQVTPAQLEGMNWSADLKEVVANSYSVRNLDNAKRQTEKAYKDDILGSYDAVRGTELNRNVTVQSLERTLRQLYQSISLKYQQLELAQQALVQEQQSFAVSEAKYQMGMISELQLLDAQNMLTSKEDNVHTAEIQLLAAYNRYSWAKRGIA